MEVKFVFAADWRSTKKANPSSLSDTPHGLGECSWVPRSYDSDVDSNVRLIIDHCVHIVGDGIYCYRRCKRSGPLQPCTRLVCSDALSRAVMLDQLNMSQSGRTDSVNQGSVSFVNSPSF